jgi:hypothetical protein
LNNQLHIYFFQIVKRNINRIKLNIKVIHIGLSTHNQDHVATTVDPVSFKTINTIVNNPAKPIPLDEDDDELLIIYNKREPN